ncbi:DNA cytosine methyltransferase (plasmid) [Alteromonas macleodii]|uniref:DNA cytosine methyltransferase n=1 Tax=Alteromonas macleodii TaxID=28108 RepID=UPI0030D40ED9
MLTIINTTVGEGKAGKRVWAEGSKLSHAVQPGQYLSPSIIKTENGVKLMLKVCDQSEGAVYVSKRTRNSIVKPLIEIRKDVLGESFRVGMKVRIVVSHLYISVEIHAQELSKTERTERFYSKLASNDELEIGSLFLGGGVLDRALHDGLNARGISSYSKFVVERESKYLDAAITNQPELFKEDSILIHSNVEDVHLEKPVPVDVLVAGIPCTGASRAGKSKNKISKAEDHDSAGACFVSVLSFVYACSPYMVVLECVPEYIQSASYSVVKSMLSHWGYRVSTEVLDGNEYGSLEGRKRMCVVAVTETDSSIDSFDFDLLFSHFEKEAEVSEVLEDIPLDSDKWKTYEYLLVKETRDKAKGNGYGRDIYVGKESKVTTIRRLYAKGGSCEQFLQHPEDPTKFRLFTAKEHCRIKKVPDYIVANLSQTVAHEILGQGVIYPVFYSLGYALGEFARGISLTPEEEKAA